MGRSLLPSLRILVLTFLPPDSLTHFQIILHHSVQHRQVSEERAQEGDDILCHWDGNGDEPQLSGAALTTSPENASPSAAWPTPGFPCGAA